MDVEYGYIIVTVPRCMRVKTSEYVIHFLLSTDFGVSNLIDTPRASSMSLLDRDLHDA